jgi:hypothetical protein
MTLKPEKITKKSLSKFSYIYILIIKFLNIFMEENIPIESSERIYIFYIDLISTYIRSVRIP